MYCIQTNIPKWFATLSDKPDTGKKNGVFLFFLFFVNCENIYLGDQMHRRNTKASRKNHAEAEY